MSAASPLAVPYGYALAATKRWADFSLLPLLPSLYRVNESYGRWLVTWAIARGANYEEALHRQEYDFDVFLFFLILIIIIDFKNNDFNITRVAIMRGTRDIYYNRRFVEKLNCVHFHKSDSRRRDIET